MSLTPAWFAASLRSLVVALVAATALGATDCDAAGAVPMVPAHELGTPGRIVNGTLTSLYPSVGALLSPGDPHFATLLCSGTLIGCHTFLTAAHCVCPFTGADCQSGPNAPNQIRREGAFPREMQRRPEFQELIKPRP